MTSRAALVTTIPMIAITVMVNGDATSWENRSSRRLGVASPVGLPKSSNSPGTKNGGDTEEERPADIWCGAQLVEHASRAPSLGYSPRAELARGYMQPMALCACQMSKPVQVPQNRTKQMTNGIYSFSGFTRKNGTKINIQMIRPIKSLVSR